MWHHVSHCLEGATNDAQLRTWMRACSHEQGPLGCGQLRTGGGHKQPLRSVNLQFQWRGQQVGTVLMRPVLGACSLASLGRALHHLHQLRVELRLAVPGQCTAEGDIHGQLCSSKAREVLRQNFNASFIFFDVRNEHGDAAQRVVHRLLPPGGSCREGKRVKAHPGASLSEDTCHHPPDGDCPLLQQTRERACRTVSPLAARHNCIRLL